MGLVHKVARVYVVDYFPGTCIFPPSCLILIAIVYLQHVWYSGYYFI